jgi:choice-of-anchor A domain-containing protein/prepilin-type N-terminal cleavage/methylation domain-containing protein
MPPRPISSWLRRRADRADRGVTLVELTVVISIMGVITTVLMGGIVVVLRSEPVISRGVSESHDQQQLLNYLYNDVRATEAVDVNNDDTRFGYTRVIDADGCPGGSAGPNVLQLTWLDANEVHRSSYRLVNDVDGALLQRDECHGSSIATLASTASVNIADQLDRVPEGWANDGPPSKVEVAGAVLTMVLSQQGRSVRASATLRNDLALLATPVTTLPPSTTAVPTTTTVPEPTTTTTTTTTTLPPTPTTTPPVTTGLCSLLGGITAAVSVVVPNAASPLLRQYGADGLAGALSTPVRVSAGLTLGIYVEIGTLALDLSVCATVQLAYNTGTADVVLPMVAEGTCTVQITVPPVLGLTPELQVCTQVALTLYVDLPASAQETWTDGPHAVRMVNDALATITDSASTLTVSVDPATVPTTTTTTTTMPPITVPTVAQGEPINPLAAAQGYSVMTEGDVSLNGIHVKGALAAGGALSFTRYANVAESGSSTVTAPGDSTTTGLMLGGPIDLSASSGAALEVRNGFLHAGSITNGQVQVNGNAVHVLPGTSTDVGSIPRVSVTNANQSDQTAYPVVRPQVFPFTNTFLALDRSSTGMGALTPTNCAAAAFPELYQQGNWILNLVTGKVNVLNLTEKQVKDMTNVTGSGSVDSGTTLVINITDHGVVQLPTRYWSQIQNGRHASIVWNFPNANKVTVTGAFYGTLFAPRADVTLASGQVKGDVVAATLTTTGDGMVEVAHFDREVPCIG